MDNFGNKQAAHQQKYALTSGIALMVMTFAASISYGLVVQNLSFLKAFHLKKIGGSFYESNSL
jgi:hypothetical protein